LPAQIGYPKPLGGILDQVDTPQFATAIGLLLLSQSNNLQKNSFSSDRLIGIVPESMYNGIKKTKHWLKQFLP
jgi:cell division ATPase FtsA